MCDSRASFSSSRRRDFTKNSTESLDEILQSFSVDKLRELVKYVSHQKKPSHQGELELFFEWRAKQTSIKQGDIIMIETINQIINEKECEEKEEEPLSKDEKFTQQPDHHENDDQDFVPDNEFLEQCEHEKEMNLKESVPPNTSQLSNHDHSQIPTSYSYNPSINSKLQSSVPMAHGVINSNCNGVDNALPSLSSASIFCIGNCPFCPVTNLSFEGYLIHFNVVHPGSYLNPIQFWQQYNYALFIKNCNQNVLQSTTTSPSSAKQKISTHEQISQNGGEQSIELKQNDNQNDIDPRYKTSPTLSPARQLSSFAPKFNNHAKGNFYISKHMISRMMNESLEDFNTINDQQDEKLAFGYYKESVALQINDEQTNIFQTDKVSMIIINIDLHFKSIDDGKSNDDTNNTMYLIAMENDQQFRNRVPWGIVDFMSSQQIKNQYCLDEYQLPQSSRCMPWYQEGIKIAPIGLNYTQINKIVQYTHFKSLPSKTSKRRQTGNDKINIKSRISEENLKYYVKQSLKYDNNSPIHPVVVIKGGNQWIEWKRYIEIRDDNGYKQSVGISMRYYETNKQWKIECMDYDAGRVYYQHRLVSLSKDNQFNYSYNQLSKYITTTLEIYRRNRWY